MLKPNTTEPILLFPSLKFSPSFSVFSRLLRGYIAIFIISVGLFGNPATIVVFCKANRWNNSGASYFFILAITDFGNIFIHGLGNWLQDGLTIVTGYKKINVLASHVVVCKLGEMFGTFCSLLSSWIVVMFAVERAIAVCSPLKATAFITNKRRRLAILLLITSTIPINILMLSVMDIQFTPGVGQSYCMIPWQTLGKSGSIILFVLFFLQFTFPTLCIIVVNFVIIFVLKCPKTTEISRQRIESSKLHKNQDLAITVNLLIISTTFALCMLPRVVVVTSYNLLTLFYERQLSINDHMNMFQLMYTTSILWMVNYACNFIIYSIRIKFFKTTMTELVKCRKSINDVIDDR
ncbi:uncharacterized protein LOC141914603 [Tubulanus polymorphus]|uniref:uncharacterized protein LOC141914603 n=1 Tax=Tubulanus polymorphus TaxID=672921 RepID=UPI003DA62F94